MVSSALACNNAKLLTMTGTGSAVIRTAVTAEQSDPTNIPRYVFGVISP